MAEQVREKKGGMEIAEKTVALGPPRARALAMDLLNAMNEEGGADGVGADIALLLCGHMLGNPNSETAKAKRKRMVRALRRVEGNLTNLGYNFALNNKGVLDTYELGPIEPLKGSAGYKPEDTEKYEEETKAWRLKRLRKVAQYMINVYEGAD